MEWASAVKSLSNLKQPVNQYLPVIKDKHGQAMEELKSFDGKVLRYRLYHGNKDNNNNNNNKNVVLVIVPGFGEHSGLYDELSQACVDAHGWSVLAYDQRGFGMSDDFKINNARGSMNPKDPDELTKDLSEIVRHTVKLFTQEPTTHATIDDNSGSSVADVGGIGGAGGTAGGTAGAPSTTGTTGTGAATQSQTFTCSNDGMPQVYLFGHSLGAGSVLSYCSLLEKESRELVEGVIVTGISGDMPFPLNWWWARMLVKFLNAIKPNMILGEIDPADMTTNKAHITRMQQDKLFNDCKKFKVEYLHACLVGGAKEDKAKSKVKAKPANDKDTAHPHMLVMNGDKDKFTKPSGFHKAVKKFDCDDLEWALLPDHAHNVMHEPGGHGVKRMLDWIKARVGGEVSGKDAAVTEANAPVSSSAIVIGE